MKTISLLTLGALLLSFTGCESAPQTKPTSHTVVATPSFQGAYIQSRDADKGPRVIKWSGPAYPFELKRKGVSGSVVIAFIVEATGQPAQIQAIRATDEAFVGPAIDAISQWRFSPGVKNGKPVACYVEQPIEFAVTDR